MGTRQRTRIRRPGSDEPGVVAEGAAERPLLPAVRPDEVAGFLEHADGASARRLLETFGHGPGNQAMAELAGGGRGGVQGASRAMGAGHGLTGTQADAGRAPVGDAVGTTVQRDEERASAAPETPATGAVETIGPPDETTYAVSASSLADVAALLGGRDEAGHVSWDVAWSYAAPEGPVAAVAVRAGIGVEMPAWTPPSTMLPRARAEWQRARAALRTHEDGHVRLVHDVFDGLAATLLGLSVRDAAGRFERAKRTLAARSRAYDATTGHGVRQGTTIDVSIEQRELDEQRRREDEASRARGRDAAVPDVGDE